MQQARPLRLGHVPYDERDDLKYEVVVSATEDVTGVYEVCFVANTWWPSLRVSDRLRMAEDSVQWALDQGLIALYHDALAEGRELAPHEWPEVLRDWRTWAIPEGPPLFVWRTDAGAEWLRRKPLPRSWWVRAWEQGTEFPGGVEHPDLS